MPTIFNPRVLRMERERQGLSQTALALMVNMEQCTISLIESGQASPSLRSLIALADALGIRVGRLFRRVPSHEPAVAA